jgi:hypothetical protein
MCIYCMLLLFRYPQMSEANNVDGNTQNSSGEKPRPVISQEFVPTSVLRKFHCDKHDQVGFILLTAP